MISHIELGLRSMSNDSRQLAVWSVNDQLFNRRHNAGDRSVKVRHEINKVQQQ